MKDKILAAATELGLQMKVLVAMGKRNGLDSAEVERAIRFRFFMAELPSRAELFGAYLQGMKEKDGIRLFRAFTHTMEFNAMEREMAEHLRQVDITTKKITEACGGFPDHTLSMTHANTLGLFFTRNDSEERE